MESLDDSQPTQATQNVVDPRRLGEQNSGFSDDDIADIACLLIPQSESARQELRKMAAKDDQRLVGRDDTNDLEIDYALEDDAQNFGLARQDVGQYHLALRLSAKLKNPLRGFTFGRNGKACDFHFSDDPFKRLSNVHFRIYFNEHGVLMLEDQSTNGTIVDNTLLKMKAKPPVETKRTLISGSKISILMHTGKSDISFLVRIPMRKGRHLIAYEENLAKFLYEQAMLLPDPNRTIVPGDAGGPPDLFNDPAHRPGNPLPIVARAQLQNAVDLANRRDGLHRSWAGSEKYNVVGELGKGAFAVVYKVTSRFSGLPYAAKELDKRRFMKNGVLDQKVENEMKIMRKIEHANIVQYVEHLDWDDRMLIIIMEYLGGGDLGRLILDFGPLKQDQTKMVASQLLSALGYLHKMNITHRDVKPDNILVHSNEPLTVKLTDFGLSKMVETEDTFLRTFCGTLLYCAPEVYSEYADYDEHGRRVPRSRHNRRPVGQRYDHAVDIWSLGGVLFYCLTKKPPYPAKSGSSHSELLFDIMTKPLNTMPLVRSRVSADGIDFITRMLDRRPDSRARVDYLLNHPWLDDMEVAPDVKVSKSYDEIADEELGIEASQLSLADNTNARDEEIIPDSDDEILDDEEDDQPNQDDQDGIDDNGSEKENYSHKPKDQTHRLFGEVGVSAVGTAGVIAADRLNLPVSAASSAATEILHNVTEIRDSFESDYNSTPRQQPRQTQTSEQLLASDSSLAESESLNNAHGPSPELESQSLGDAESRLGHLNVKSVGGSRLGSRDNELNKSKRKPSSDSSDGSDASGTDGPVLKRLRSQGSVQPAPEIVLNEDELELMTQIPAMTRRKSKLDYDGPVHKSVWWSAADKYSWHTYYPAMTHLQLEAFRTAAEARHEQFLPGETPLWDIAMKFFATGTVDRSPLPGADGDNSAGGTLPANQMDTSDLDSIPDTQPPEQYSASQVPRDALGKQVVACFQSTPHSAVPDISLPVTESMVSWGRAPENTRPYALKAEAKVPKYAFKLLLWKEHFDSGRDSRPWLFCRKTSPAGLYFYLSTKATNGIWVNDIHVPSDNCKNPAGPCRNWVRLYDGDSVVIWQTSDGSCKTELTFHCLWGPSAQPRPAFPDPHHRPFLIPEPTASKLDAMGIRAEGKMHLVKEQDIRMIEADRDLEERRRNLDLDRTRSRNFDKARSEAGRMLRRIRVSPVPSVGDGWKESSPFAIWNFRS